MCRRFVIPCAVAQVTLLLAVSLQAADDVLSMIPDAAYGIAYVRNLEQTSDQISRISELVGQQGPSPLEFTQATTGLKDGIDTKGTLAVAVLPGTDGRPTPVVLVPVSDYAALLKQLQPDDPNAAVAQVTVLGQNAVVARKGSFAVLAPADQRQVLDAVLEVKQGITDQLRPLQNFLQQGNSAVVLTRGGIVLSMDEALEGLEVIKNQLAGIGQDNQNIAAGLAVYETLFQQIKSNATHFALSLRVSDGNDVHLASRMLVTPDSELAKLGRATPQTPQAPMSKPLAGLPAGPYVVAVHGQDFAAWADLMMQWSTGMFRNMVAGTDLTEDEVKKLAQLSQGSLEGVHAMSMMMGSGNADAPLYGRLFFTLRTTNSQAYIDSYEKVIQQMGQLAKEGKLPFYGDVAVEKVQVENTPALKVSMGLAAAAVPGVDPEQLKEMYRKMFGGDKLLVYLAAANPTTVVGAYTSQERLAEALRVARSPQAADLSADSQTAITSGLLMDGAQWVAYVSPQGSVSFVQQMGALTGAPVPPIPEFPAAPPFGFAIRLNADGVETDMVVPAATLKAIGEYIAKVQAANLQ